MASANTAQSAPEANIFMLEAKTQLLRQGKTVTELASELGLARNTVSIAINHPTMLPSVKQRIAKHLRFS